MDIRYIFENHQGVVLLALVFLCWLALRSLNRQSGAAREYPYIKSGMLLTKGEKVFYDSLLVSLPPSCVIAIKVRLGDLISVKKGLSKKEALIARSKIQQKHIDFVLCRRDSMEVVCCIELNDSSHAAKDRVQRDLFVREACKAAGLPLLEIKAAASYSVVELKTKLIEICLLDEKLPQDGLILNKAAAQNPT